MTRAARHRTPFRGNLTLAISLATAAALTGASARSASAAAPPAHEQADTRPPSNEAPDADAQRRARHSYEVAEAHFKAGNFREALAEYKAGYDAAALPGFLINIAQCKRRLGDLAGALTTYRKFVLVAPDSPFVPQVQGMIQELEKLGPEVTEGEGAPARESPLPVAGLAAAAPAPVLVGGSEAPATPPSSRKTWWVVGGVAAAAVVGGTVAIFALRGGDSTTTVHDGTLGTLRR